MGAWRRKTYDTIEELNRLELERWATRKISTAHFPIRDGVSNAGERPGVMDISKEPAAIHEMYGTQPGKSAFANNCLLARRLVERGVRFVQLYHWGWDSHGDMKDNDIRYGMVDRCREVDQPSAALIMDLKQRGLLEDTLVIWGGEFGRTPMNENRNRDGFLGVIIIRMPFSVWMAGAAWRHGMTYGATDDIGYRVRKTRCPCMISTPPFCT